MSKQGETASFAVVKEIMDNNNLKSSHCNLLQRSLTGSRKSHGDEIINLTKRLEIVRPFQMLSSDITYKTDESI